MLSIKELCFLLKTAKDVSEIDEKRKEIVEIIPKVSIMFEYDQNNHAHQYDLWMHSLHTVLNLPRNIDDDMLYLAALLHDIGKPDCRCGGKKEGDTNSHFYGHPEKSYEIVRDEVLPYIKSLGLFISKEDEYLLLYYVLHHDDHISLRVKYLRKHLESIDLESFKHLMLLEVADAKAHVLIPVVQQRVEICSQWSGEYADIMKKKLDNGL
jgi:hypothetical protein